MQTKLEEFFSNHHLSPEMETSRSFIFDCPSCGGRHKLYIQKEDGRSVCFKGKSSKCPKPGSDAVYALAILAHMPMDEVKKELHGSAPQLQDYLHVSFDAPEERKRDPLPPGTLPLDITMIDDPIAIDGLNYLLGRGLTAEVLKEQGIMYRPSVRMVIFPVIMNGILYGWQGRAIDPVPKERRMDNLPGEWKSRTVMFHGNIVGKEFVIIAEGPVSAMKFANMKNYVATMGKEISSEQMKILRESGMKRLYIALDPDAFDKIHKIRETLPDVECYFVEVPEGREDFGDCTYEECEAAFKSAQKITGDEIFVHLEFQLKGNI